MKYRVNLVRDAEEDLLGICRYVAQSGSPVNAERLLDGIEQAVLSLETMPERGHIPPELKRIHIHDYREIHFKLYRIIYQVIHNEVFVHCILDGRRDILDLLHQRLLSDAQIE